MLRESNNTIGTTFDMTDVTGGVSGGTDIPHAGLLSAFAEAVYHRDAPLIAEKQVEQFLRKLQKPFEIKQLRGNNLDEQIM